MLTDHGSESQFSPDGQMIGCPFRLCGIVSAGTKYAQIFSHDDPVKTRHRALRMEAGTGEDDAVIMEELDKAASVARPLVKVTHQDCRHFSRPLQHGIKNRAHLPLAPQAGKIEMHPDNAQVLLANAALNKDGPSRFERGDIKGHAIQHLDV